MEGLSTSAFLSLSIIYLMVNYVRSELSVEECKGLGFVKNNLLCSSCALLPQYDLDILKKHCESCCVQETSDSTKDEGSAKTVKRYPKAPFVKSDRPGKFPNLEVKYMGGQMPQIKLLEGDDSVAETLSITKWDTDTIVEFLQTYLEPPARDPNDITDDDDDDDENNITKNEL
ncbi:15 kDa selenoprotein [Folsomia candida]|uniref:Selenoprotein F n=1 Tax=Folsomia candida TaxID=158441 RepID=A0A226E214_FOLCA|nr:15 kDa selenoprotein [Folsomia candida]